MVILLNYVIYIVLLIILWLGVKAYKKADNTKKKKVVALKYVAIALFTNGIYVTVQPSLLPKGTVPVIQKVPLLNEEVVLQDRLLKPASDSKQVLEKELTYKKEIKQLLKENNSKEK